MNEIKVYKSIQSVQIFLNEDLCVIFQELFLYLYNVMAKVSQIDTREKIHAIRSYPSLLTPNTKFYFVIKL